MKVLIFLCIFFFITTCVSTFYLFRFARIVLILEDDFEEAINVFNNCLASIDKLLTLKMFFDSKEIKEAVENAMQDIKLSRMAVSALIEKFVQRSKQKYIILVENEEE